MPSSHHHEQHYIHRTGWLRASVLGANDGIISVTSLVLGIAASGASSNTLLISCVAGLISGAVSMAAGEYISVKSQSDIEAADLESEARELQRNPHAELKELTQIYISRGLDAELAHQVAVQLSEHNALAAHARDEIGISDAMAAKPLQAAFSSALSFSIGALLPTLTIIFSPEAYLTPTIAVVGILSLAILGALSSYAGGSSLLKGATRVTLWGILAMVFSTWIGSLFQI
ncbi:VIT family protein [Acinetobacter sp. 194]|uniref:VIT1/CCC1 transporter family protein n=1 Tax=Acinetobacter shaoyimingii TaxID=2715164 RepID=UPI001409A596|nr:VIT family protein [Acinetobacter shaoyimingii]NHB58154.1 VIT family protein [Acinetobacter shaoyimingii]